jgi:two-component system, OmpR family, response regulator
MTGALETGLSHATSEKRARVLVIEDDKGLSEEICADLERLGYSVRAADTLAEGLHEARLADAAVIIVDRMLHEFDGLDMIETLREEGIRTPVLFISSLSSVDERIRGLKAGGDDYLVKPFAMAELTARVEALLRRLDDMRATRLRAGGLEMDLIEQTVKRGDVLIELLPREFKLLEYFLRRPRQLVTRAMLLQDVWHYRFTPDTNVVDVHIGNLRRKIDAPGAPTMIKNIRGSGFMLNADA